MGLLSFEAIKAQSNASSSSVSFKYSATLSHFLSQISKVPRASDAAAKSELEVKMGGYLLILR